MQLEPTEIKEQLSNIEQPEAREELDRSTRRNRIICPITGLIFKAPVLLIPDVTNPSWSARNATTTIEQESYAEMIRARGLYCPVTRLPILGFMRNIEIELLVEEYLNAYPEEEQQQYQLQNTSTQENEPTITEQDDIRALA